MVLGGVGTNKPGGGGIKPPPRGTMVGTIAAHSPGSRNGEAKISFRIFFASANFVSISF